MTDNRKVLRDSQALRNDCWLKDDVTKELNQILMSYFKENEPNWFL